MTANLLLHCGASAVDRETVDAGYAPVATRTCQPIPHGDLVDEYSANPDTVILTHSYDRAIPDGRPAVFAGGAFKFGPWLKPFMEAKGITSAKDQQAIVTYFLKQTAARQRRVARDHPRRFKIVPTFGTLDKSDWANELHPAKPGFKKLGDKIWIEMQKHF